MEIYRNAITFAIKRLLAHRWLALSQMVGLLAAVALAVSVPLYSDGVNYNILSTSLATSASQTRRQPFDFVFRYIGSWYGPVTTGQYEPINAYLSDQAAGRIGLPQYGLNSLHRHVEFAALPGFRGPLTDSAVGPGQTGLSLWNLRTGATGRW